MNDLKIETTKPTPKAKTEMLIILGMLEALRFPISDRESSNIGVHDCLDYITDKYKRILEDLEVL